MRWIRRKTFSIATRAAWVSAAIFMLQGCAAVIQPPASSAAPPFFESGADVLRHLNSRHADSATQCGTSTAPAFVCSGIMIRGTSVSANYHSWEVNPSNPKFPAVSFSWLRHDAVHTRLAYTYDTGFIFYPKTYADSHGFRPVYVTCAFPIDGATDYRAQSGCGASRAYPTQSGPCNSQSPPITTSAQWRAHFDKVAASGIDAQMNYQCGFDVSINTPQSASLFMQTVYARQGLDMVRFKAKPNEIILNGWPAGSGSTLPIEAFFYLAGTPNGKANAQFIQRDFYNVTGRWVAIIAITLPESPSGATTFAYHPADQGVPAP